ncbi:adenosylcobinamide-GDP ribazoletransferase [Pseudoalteromonas piscicida]|uniref:Adenosylcobinamide-GDP ribazoletransferase n=1 Tax=Pseudoalteromonas piscicida TaxID=43662 RepID=A0A2A5JRK1_PSEO7|nr:adenosylcobinamide-GDP ribazoletransferase [Pseudoalteromonas piscicida]PCK32026.1 adenosylcobinamide-GDP ribazoletransferase [Pseudoalteromonas piscicida]
MQWQQEWRLFKLAMVFLTRVPIRLRPAPSPDELNEVSGYFCLVGVLIGAISAAFGCVASDYISPMFGAVAALSAGVLLTGAFHEDGFADVFDGFGGGWTKEQKLEIMKDSRLGTYGSCALLLLLLAKFSLLTMLFEDLLMAWVSLLLAHSLSRALAVSLIGSLGYVQADQLSKVKPVAKRLSDAALTRTVITSSLILVACWPWLALSLIDLLVLLVWLYLLRLACIKWFHTQLGGYTGDCLGAAQQLGELVILLFIVGTL